MSKRNVCLIPQDEPEFIRKLKSQVGYKEEKVDVNAKFQENVEDDEKKSKSRPDIDSDDEEYKPQIVVLKSSGLTEEDFKKFKPKDNVEDEEPGNGRMIFRKPKRKLDEKDSDTPSKKQSLKKEKTTTTVKRNLLSFDLDE